MRHRPDDRIAHIVHLAASSAFIAGPVPVNGTIVGLMPIAAPSSRHPVCDTEPMPACAMFSFASFAFA
jgi:hypothetical protein